MSKKNYRWLAAGLLSFYLAAPIGQSADWTFHGGLGAWEQTDDRLKPALGIAAERDSQNFLMQWIWFRWSFGPVYESQHLLTASKTISLSSAFWPGLHASFGGAYLVEETKISPIDGYDGVSDKSWNLGLALGIRQRFLIPNTRWFVVADWTSALFPAGLEGMIFLAYGRKEWLALGMGVDL